MPVPGFTATAALAPTAMPAPALMYFGYGVDLGPGFGMWCLYNCINAKLSGTAISGQDLNDAMIECALACGVYYSPTLISQLMAWARSLGLIGEAGAGGAAAAEGGGSTVAAGAGLGAGTAAAAVTVTLAALAWLGWKVHVAGGSPPPVAPGGTLPKAGTPNPCAGFVTTDLVIKGWGVDAAHWSKSACQVAIEDAQANALTECAKYNNLCAGKNCTSGRCVALPVVDTVSNQTHLFWCGARIHYRCACYCV